MPSRKRGTTPFEEAAEWLLLIKTTDDAFDALRERVVQVHPYEVPELVAVPIAGGLP